MAFIDNLATALDVGGKLFGYWNTKNTADDYVQSMRDKEQYAYDMAKLNNDAYAQYLQGANAHSAGAAGAASAAHAASEAQRMAALQKAIGFSMDMMKKANKDLKPYRKAGRQVIKPATDIYLKGLEGLGKVSETMLSPEGMKPLTAKSGFYDQQVGPLPEWLTNMKVVK